MSEIKLGIIGAGSIARKHLEAVAGIDWMRVVGLTSRTRSKAETLLNDFAIPDCCDDINELIESCRPDALLITVSADQMYSVTKEVFKRRLPFLMEKPPGLDPGETKRLAEIAGELSVPNMVGYNRRYYSIFHKGLNIIKEHGALLGVAIEGHERFWKIAGEVNDHIRDRWIYVNSTHTIDLLRFFGGELVNVHALKNNHLEKRGDQFAAVMEFESGALGSYISYWYSPGGWGVRLFGEGVTVEFMPLEEGKWSGQDLIAHSISPDEVDVLYKPGFLRQMEAFGKLVQTEILEWPGVGLQEAFKTMLLAKKITS